MPPAAVALTASDHITAIEIDGRLLAEAAGRVDLDAVVPSCPGWHVRDLLRHVCYVHRYAAGYVRDARTERAETPTEEEILRTGPDDGSLVESFREGCAELVNTLRQASPDLVCWTFLDAPSPLAFWARRQAHETAIHRVDAELASGPPSTFPAR